MGVDVSKQQQTSDWGSVTLFEAQKDYAASDRHYLHRLKDALEAILIREDRLDLAQRGFAFLSTRADAGAEGVESLVTRCPLDYRFDLGAVLVVVAQRRERDLRLARLARLAVAQDQQAGRRDPLGQHLIAQGCGGKRLQPRVQGCEDGFTSRRHDDVIEQDSMGIF